MKIEILGTGCPKCKILYKNTVQAVKNTGINAQIVIIEDIDTIISYGVFMPPAIVINGKVKLAGEAVSPEEIEKLLLQE
jgi:small redox-active disulfide protein 2